MVVVSLVIQLLMSGYIRATDVDSVHHPLKQPLAVTGASDGNS